MQPTISLHRASPARSRRTIRSPFRRAALALVSAVAALGILTGATTAAYNVYLNEYTSGKIGSSSGFANCVQDVGQRYIFARAPRVNSSTGYVQMVATKQVFQKWMYDSRTRTNTWKDVYVAPVRVHDYSRNQADMTADSYTPTSAGYYRVVTDIAWPTGKARALYEHQIKDRNGWTLTPGLEWCQY